jgi:hypothetical protein
MIANNIGSQSKDKKNTISMISLLLKEYISEDFGLDKL